MILSVPDPIVLSWPIPHPVLDCFQRECTALIRPPCSLPPPRGPEPIEHIHTHLLIPHLTSRDLQCSGKQSINTEKTLPEKLRGLYSQTNILGIPAYYRMGWKWGGRGRRRDEGARGGGGGRRISVANNACRDTKDGPKVRDFSSPLLPVVQTPPDSAASVTPARTRQPVSECLARASRAACTFFIFYFLARARTCKARLRREKGAVTLRVTCRVSSLTGLDRTAWPGSLIRLHNQYYSDDCLPQSSGANFKHWFTSFLRRKVPESDARSVAQELWKTSWTS